MTRTVLLSLPLLLGGCPLPAAQVHESDGPRPDREFVQGPWLASKGAPTVASYRGRVLVVHFFTFGCSNCQANVPFYNQWHKNGVSVVGVHTPEMDFERSRTNVERALKSEQVEYPVLLDDEAKNWKAWGVEYWPTVFVFDKAGRVRKTWIGEFHFDNRRGFEELSELIGKLEKE